MVTLLPDQNQNLRLAEHAVLEACGLRLTPEFITILDAEPRELTVYGGWRAGKSSLAAAKVEKRIWRWQMEASLGVGRPRLVWVVGPDYEQTKAEYGYLREWNGRLGNILFASDAQEGSLTMTLKGNITIVTKSASHPERLGSVAPDFILVCEAGQVSDETRIMMTGRAAEKRANICYTGTLEDDEGHTQWAWYQELGQRWLNGQQCQEAHDCTVEHNAFSLPSWANVAVFPGGRDDPEIKRQEALFFDQTGSDYTFRRRIAGEPTGLQFQVYPYLDTRNLLLPFPNGERHIGGAGGIDYGTVHPSALGVGHLLHDPRDDDPKFVGPRGILWIREVAFKDKDPGDTTWVQKTKSELANRYRVWQWATDPNERYMARDHGVYATSGSAGAREHRIGLVTARLLLGKLFFDSGGPGVPDLYQEMRRVHRRKQRDGELRLVRDLDDRTAAVEDLVEVLDGSPPLRFPRSMQGTYMKRPAGRRKEFQRIR